MFQFPRFLVSSREDTPPIPLNTTFDYNSISIIKNDLGSSIPDNIVVLHPNHQNAEWQNWVKLVCEQTGALWRHIIYRDLVGVRWQFSAFVDHGVPLKGKDVIILDDGTCTGDTITALIETCAIGGAKKIFAYFFTDRMPLIKSDLMARMRKIQSEMELDKGKSLLATIKIRALGGIQIPVYTTDSCPICSQRDEAEKIISSYVSISKIAQNFLEQLDSHDVSDIEDDIEENTYITNFPWLFPVNISLVWKIRQALEYFPYDEPSANGGSESSFELLQNATTQDEGALAFGFIVCTEPRITMNKWFRKHAKDILELWIRNLDTNFSNKKEIATLITAIFRVSENGSIEKEFSKDKLVKIVIDKLPNDQIGRYAAEQLLIHVACGLICKKGSYRQLHAAGWMASIYNLAKDNWLQYPLKYIIYIIKLTMFQGGTLRVGDASDYEKTIIVLHENINNLVTFIGLHSTDDEVDFKLKDHIKKLREKIDSEALTGCINFLESFENRIASFFYCSQILSGIKLKRADISHPLIITSTLWTRELQQIAEMYGEIIDGIENILSLLSTLENTTEQLKTLDKKIIDIMESILKMWQTCKNDIQSFLKEFLVNVRIEANDCINNWHKPTRKELLSNVVFEGSGGVPHFLYPIDKFYTLNDLS